jgi:3-polyprenyl-4-hydroxybenzoate decarboxylase
MKAKLIVIFSLLIILNGCNYFTVYEKTNYVSLVTPLIRKNQDDMNNYIKLCKENSDDKKVDEKVKKKFEEVKNVFTENKENLETLKVPEAYKNEHSNFLTAFQNCIDASDTSINILSVKDKKERQEKITDVRDKMEKARKLIKTGLDRISIDLR